MKIWKVRMGYSSQRENKRLLSFVLLGVVAGIAGHPTRLF